MLLVGVLLLLCGYPSGAFCEGTAGIGVSDYEKNVNVTLGASESFEVARVSNEGTLGLTITATWKPDYASGIELKLTPKTLHLDSGEAMLVSAQVVRAEQTGTYSGTVEFTTKVDSQANGNPSSPAGSAHATFNVISATGQSDNEFDWKIGAVIIAVVLSIVLALLMWRRKSEE
jgi:hypothetical protein